MGSQNGELAGTDDAALFTLGISVPPGSLGDELEIVRSQGNVTVRGTGDDAAAVQSQPRDLLGLGGHRTEEGHLDGTVGAGQTYRLGVGRVEQVGQAVDHQAVGLFDDDLGPAGRIPFIPGEHGDAAHRGLDPVDAVAQIVGVIE